MGAPSLLMGNQPERAKWYRAGASWGTVSLACSCHPKCPECLYFPEREAEKKKKQTRVGQGRTGKKGNQKCLGGGGAHL